MKKPKHIASDRCLDCQAIYPRSYDACPACQSNVRRAASQ